MKKFSIVIFAFTATLLLTECAKKNQPAKSKTNTTADEVAAIKAKYTPEQIAQGKMLFDSKCGACHDLKPPADFTIHEWNKILPDMSQKSKLTADQAGLVRSWVITNAKAS